jgi:hypothetical protein
MKSVLLLCELVRTFCDRIDIRGEYIANPYINSEVLRLCGEALRKKLVQCVFKLCGSSEVVINGLRGVTAARYNGARNILTFYGRDMLTAEVIAHELRHLMQTCEPWGKISDKREYFYRHREVDAFWHGIIVNYLCNYNVWGDLAFYTRVITIMLWRRSNGTMKEKSMRHYYRKTAAVLFGLKTLDRPWGRAILST